MKVYLNLQTFHLHCYILVNQVIYVSYYYKQFLTWLMLLNAIKP